MTEHETIKPKAALLTTPKIELFAGIVASLIIAMFPYVYFANRNLEVLSASDV